MVCKRPQEYVAHANWVLEFGRVHGRRLEHDGSVTSIRVWYEDGLEVEFGIAGEDWAASPLDPGTRQVIAGGMIILCEQDRLLSRLQAEIEGRQRAGGLP